MHPAAEQRVLSTTPIETASQHIDSIPNPPQDFSQHSAQLPIQNLTPPSTQPHDPLPDNAPLQCPIGKQLTTPSPPIPRITRQQVARQRALALNLSIDGSPLTYSKAKAGPHAAQ